MFCVPLMIPPVKENYGFGTFHNVSFILLYDITKIWFRSTLLSYFRLFPLFCFLLRLQYKMVFNPKPMQVLSIHRYLISFQSNLCNHMTCNRGTNGPHSECILRENQYACFGIYHCRCFWSTTAGTYTRASFKPVKQYWNFIFCRASYISVLWAMLSRAVSAVVWILVEYVLWNRS